MTTNDNDMTMITCATPTTTTASNQRIARYYIHNDYDYEHN